MEEYFDTKLVGHKDTNVSEWCAIKQLLISEVDGNELLFKEMKTLSQPQLKYAKLDEIPDCSAYFERLENNFDEYDVIDFLINLASCMQHHVELGTIEVATLLKRHRKILEDFREKCNKEGLFKDKYFVGRKDYIKSVEQRLIDEGEVGFCICGMGGVGKTSVAREICIRLWKRKKKWKPKKIDLREVGCLKDLLRDTLVKLGERYEEKSTNNLVDQLFNFLRNSLHDRTILLLDNIDDVLEHDCEEVLNFLKQLMNFLKEIGEECKVRILITSREELLFDHERQTTLQTKELQSLDKTDAISLLKKCTKGVVITPDQEENIVTLCGCNPLALRTLSSSLKSRLVTPGQIIFNLQHRFQTTCVTEALNVRRCIQQTFGAMDITLQNKLIQLSVFRTAPFDTAAASAVLKTKDEVTTLDILCLKSRHLIEVRDKYADPHFTDDGEQNLSLHPLVYAFLREEVNKEDNYQNIFRIAQLQFVKYFHKIAMKYGEKKNKNFVKFQSNVERYRLHLTIFFDILTSFEPETYNENTLVELHDISSNRRLCDLILFMQDDGETAEFARTIANNAFKRGDIIQGIFWKVEEGIALLESEKIDESFEVMEDTEKKFDPLNMTEEENASIFGRFFYLKGRLYNHKKLIDESLEYFQKSLTFYEVKTIQSKFFSELADVYNCIGTAYFKMEPPDVSKAKFNHEKAMELVQKFSKNNHPEIANYMTNVAACLNVEGFDKQKSQSGEELPILRKALQLSSQSINLDVELDRHKTKVKDYAMKLAMRANIHQALKDFDNSLEDNKHALGLRRRIFKEPHDLITISTHRIGNVLRLKAVKAYRAHHSDLALELFREAESYYDQALSMIQIGGLSKDYQKEYILIRDNHINLVGKVLQNENKGRHIELMYTEYECGTFDREAKRIRARSMLEAEELLDEDNPSILLSSSSDDETVASSSSSRSSTSPENSETDNEQDSSMETQKHVSEETTVSSTENQSDNYGMNGITKTESVENKQYPETSKLNLEDEKIKRMDSGISTGCGTASEELNRSLSYQSSVDEVFTTEHENTNMANQLNQRRISSGYSSGYSVSSTSIDCLDEKKTHVKRSLSLPQSTSSNPSRKRTNRSSSQITPLSAFVEKITKSKHPKLSKGLLGDSFDEEQEQE